MLTRCCSPPENVTGERLQSRSGIASRARIDAARAHRLVARGAERAEWLGHHVERGHARDHAQELAHVADRAAPDLEDPPRLSTRDIDGIAPMTDEDPAGLRPVVAVDAAQQRALARARRIGQRQALAGAHREAHATQHGQLEPTLPVQRERLAEILDPDRLGAHGWRTDDTRSCVYAC